MLNSRIIYTHYCTRGNKKETSCTTITLKTVCISNNNNTKHINPSQEHFGGWTENCPICHQISYIVTLILTLTVGMSFYWVMRQFLVLNMLRNSQDVLTITHSTPRQTANKMDSNLQNRVPNMLAFDHKEVAISHFLH